MMDGISFGGAAAFLLQEEDLFAHWRFQVLAEKSHPARRIAEIRGFGKQSSRGHKRECPAQAARSEIMMPHLLS